MEFDDQQSDLADAVESLRETERRVLALPERAGFVTKRSARCRGLRRKPREFRPFVRYVTSIWSIFFLLKEANGRTALLIQYRRRLIHFNRVS